MDAILAHLYIDIAALFDLRIATLSMIDTDLAIQVTQQPGYYLREIDEFSTPEHGVLDKDLYQKVYEANAYQLIEHALPTAMFEWVRQWLLIIMTRKTGSPFHGGLQVTVNTYPLQLTQEDQLNLLTGFKAHWSDMVEIQLIYQAPEDVRLDDGYTSMVLYNPVKILEANSKQLETKRHHMLNVYIPRLNWGRALTPHEEAEFKKNKQDPFMFLEDGVRPYMKLEVQPVCLYCFDCDKNPAN